MPCQAVHAGSCLHCCLHAALPRLSPGPTPSLPALPPPLAPKPYALTHATHLEVQHHACASCHLVRAIILLDAVLVAAHCAGPHPLAVLLMRLGVHSHTVSNLHSRPGTATQACTHAACRSAVKTGWVGPRQSTRCGCECHSCGRLSASHRSTWWYPLHHLHTKPHSALQTLFLAILALAPPLSGQLTRNAE